MWKGSGLTEAKLDQAPLAPSPSAQVDNKASGEFDVIGGHFGVERHCVTSDLGNAGGSTFRKCLQSGGERSDIYCFCQTLGVPRCEGQCVGVG